MLNYLWALMILTGIIFAAFTGNLPDITDAALTSSKEAISLCITMMGIMSLWVGLMEIAAEAGVIHALSHKLRPFLRYLFPHLPENHPATKHIATNMIANFLGLGWAATPAGLKAMEELSKFENERRYTSQTRSNLSPAPHNIASKEMCTFLIINISSLQLIPVNVIAYRSQYGSVNPAAIVGAGIIATSISTLTAIIYCRIHDH